LVGAAGLFGWQKAQGASGASIPSELDWLRPHISFELADTPRYLPPARRLSWWLTRNETTIMHASGRWHVAPTAIAGVVAYEALANPEPAAMAMLARYSGPGKVHYKEYHFAEGEPVSAEVERMGYLPRVMWRTRERILATDSGSIRYIAAILRAYSDIARHRGYSINCNVGLLTTFYTAWDIPQVRALLKQHPQTLRPNTAGVWVKKHISLIPHYLSSSRCTSDSSSP
jgi:hypothetical protein